MIFCLKVQYLYKNLSNTVYKDQNIKKKNILHVSKRNFNSLTVDFKIAPLPEKKKKQYENK